VIAIARELTKRGLTVAVLTRGYGRAGSAAGLVTSLDAGRFGDEPVLIKSKLSNVHVIVGSKRYENAILFLSQNDCDVFVLDDGFQHLQLARDLDVVINAGNGWMREGRSALADAGIVMQRNLRLAIPQELNARRVFAFAGLADNEQFFASLAATARTSSPGDPLAIITLHVRGPRVDQQAAAKSGAEAIVTTEKDAVKIQDVTSSPSPPRCSSRPRCSRRSRRSVTDRGSIRRSTDRKLSFSIRVPCDPGIN